MGVIGCGEGVVYRASPGRPTDIGLQLGKTCYPCKRVRGGGGGGECFYFFCFFTFTLILSFVSATVSSISFLHFSGRQHKMTHKVDVSLNHNTITVHAG